MAVAEWIEIRGLRGFSTTCRISFGVPNGQNGSGMTILVGPNNSGKSTVVEAINAMSPRYSAPSFAEGKRNVKADRLIEISIGNRHGAMRTLRSLESGGSETEWVEANAEPATTDIFVLPSRRTFNPFFVKSDMDRSTYTYSCGLPPTRGMPMDNFGGRIFHILNNRKEFNMVLARVLEPLPNWTIELSDSGQYYLKFESQGQEHTSDGLGEGLISLFFIIDALYDSKPGSMIVIDEPELSLHPSLQRRLAAVLADYAKDRQIVIATHSPYFIDWHLILAGAMITRIVKESDTIAGYELKTRDEIKGLLENKNNPHILGLDAREVFFLEDGVILVEGQEDVVCYREIAAQLDMSILGEFYGWGVGGAGNMQVIARVLKELGFRRVAGILDKGKERDCHALTEEFIDYKFFVIPADDVRTKEPVNGRKGVDGLLDADGHLREEYRNEMHRLLEGVNLATNPG